MLHLFPQVSSGATLDELKESWRLYTEECERNNSGDPPSTGEPNTEQQMFDSTGIHSNNYPEKQEVNIDFFL